MADGNIVYQGDAKASVKYFESTGYPVPQFANPADYFMKILSIRYPKQEEDVNKIDKLCRNYRTMNVRMVKAESRMVRLEPPAQEGA